jgi:hypothetical protein
MACLLFAELRSEQSIFSRGAPPNQSRFISYRSYTRIDYSSNYRGLILASLRAQIEEEGFTLEPWAILASRKKSQAVTSIGFSLAQAKLSLRLTSGRRAWCPVGSVGYNSNDDLNTMLFALVHAGALPE